MKKEFMRYWNSSPIYKSVQLKASVLDLFFVGLGIENRLYTKHPTCKKEMERQHPPEYLKHNS